MIVVVRKCDADVSVDVIVLTWARCLDTDAIYW
jgi:hypothetical protein